VDRGKIPGAWWWLTTRFGGCSLGAFAESNLAEHVGDDADAVAKNRRAAAALVPGVDSLAFVAAEHGARVQRVHTAAEVGPGDALITDVPALGLAALGADCAIVGLSGQRADGTRALAVVHCGWKGLVVDVVGRTVAELRAGGAVDIAAIQGPAICGSCYRVPAERCQAVSDACSPSVSAAAVVRHADAQGSPWGIDIGAGVRTQLTDYGVDLVESFGCTYEDSRWFSLRRAVDHGGPSARTGRHALVMAIA
jgi:YfiH family protein